ncbi:MAG: DUF945 family protein [Pseudomonadota bacterium]
MNLIRILLIASLPVAALIAVPPALIGPQVEEQVQIGIAQASDNPVASIRLTEYTRGWFGAEGRIVVQAREEYLDAVLAERAAEESAQDSQAAASMEEVRASLLEPVEFDLDIAHGALLFQNGLGLGAASAVLTLEDTFKEDLPELEMDGEVTSTMRVAFDRSVDFAFDIPSFELRFEPPDEPAGEVQFLGLASSGRYDTVASEVVYAATMPLLSVKIGDNVVISVDNTAFEGTGQELTEDVWLGDFNWTTAQMRISAVDEDAGDTYDLLMERFNSNMAVDQDKDSNLLFVEMGYSIDHMVAEEYEGGFNLPITVRNIPVETMQGYMSLLDDPAAAAAFEDDTAPVTEKLTEQLLGIFEPWLAASPELRVGPAKVDLPDGTLNVDMRVLVSGDEFSKVGIAAMADPNVLGQVLSATLDASVPVAQAESLAKWVLTDQITSGMAGQPPEYQLTPEQAAEMAAQQAPGMLSELVQQGIIEREGDNYTAAIKVKDGSVDMNGLVLPLGMFAQ